MSEKQYTEVHGGQDESWLTPPRIVTVDPAGQGSGIPYVVAIGESMDQCYRFVEQMYPGMTQDEQVRELSHIDLWGDAGIVCVNYIAMDAPGWSAALAMWALSDLGYDLTNLCETYLLP
jgi:hypothetical protein